jgi:predicted Fe-Mo cluster-binding NifX family protein
MRIAIPMEEGVEGPVCGHLGRASFLTVVDSQSGELEVLKGLGHHEGHGACEMGGFLAAHGIQGVVANRVGRGALQTLSEAGITVLASEGRTVARVIEEARRGLLRPASVDQVRCGGSQCGH